MLKHHGNTKAKAVEELVDHDIVLTTYATLATALRSQDALLYQITWFRVILDEGKPALL